MKIYIRITALLTAAAFFLCSVLYCRPGAVYAEETLSETQHEDGTSSETQLEDGEYQIDGQMRHATQDQLSMGNAALVKPFTLIKNGDQLTLKLEFVSLQNGLFTGYLYKLYYFPDYDGDTVPYLQKPEELTVTDYYDGIYDYYNDPETGADALAKGNLYPHHMTMPVKQGQTDIWVEVYVPVMEAISAGSGSQFAKLKLDWKSVKKIGENTASAEPEKSNDANATASPGNNDEDSVTASPEVNDEDTVSASPGTGGENAVTASPGNNAVSSVTAVPDEYKKDNAETSASPDTKNGGNISATAAPEGKSDSGDSGDSGNTGNNENSGNTASVTLDPKNLSDGTYTVTGKMVKTDKKTASMSNDAIDHTITLRAEGGKITAYMTFTGLTINKTKGYLGKLKYYKTGYKLNKYGAPTGDLGNASVITYQTDSDGNKLKDTFGTDYPAQVSFELISEALDDGYVPLQVFVPVMESISAGTGTQPVFLKLDWSTLSAGNVSAQDSSGTASSGGSSGSSESETGTDSGSDTSSKNSKKNKKNKKNSKSKKNSSKSSTKNSSENSAGSGSSAVNADTALPGSTSDSSGSSSSGSFGSTVPVPGTDESGSTVTGDDNDDVISEPDNDDTADDNSADAETDNADSSASSGNTVQGSSQDSGSTETDTNSSGTAGSGGSDTSSESTDSSNNKSAVSIVISIIAVLAGILYKAGSRGVFAKKYGNKEQ